MGFWESKMNKVDRDFTRKGIMINDRHTIKNLVGTRVAQKGKRILRWKFSFAV
jgi:hypothetical protein